MAATLKVYGSFQNVSCTININQPQTKYNFVTAKKLLLFFFLFVYFSLVLFRFSFFW